MKKLIYLTAIISTLFLSGCCTEEYITDEKKEEQIFRDCMKLAVEARKGVNYTTNDDEDFDEVIAQCESTSTRISSRYERVCK